MNSTVENFLHFLNFHKDEPGISISAFAATPEVRTICKIENSSTYGTFMGKSIRVVPDYEAWDGKD